MNAPLRAEEKKAADSVHVAPDTVKVVATVNGEAITKTMIERQLIRIHTMMAAESSRTNFSLDKLVQRMINDLLLEQEARNVGLEQDSGIVERVVKYRANAAYKLMMKVVFPDTFRASEDEIRAEYAKDFQRFGIRTLCVTDSALAVALADSIRHGAPMADLAKRHSIDQFKEKGGDAGSYALLDIPPVVQPRIIDAKPGDVLGPYFLWRTWALIQLESRLDHDSATVLDSVRTTVERMVVEAKRKAAQHDHALKMRATVPVMVDTVQIDSMLYRYSLNLPASGRALITVGGTNTISETDLRGKYVHRAVSNADRDQKKVLWELCDEQVEMLLLQAEAAQSKFSEMEEVREPVKAYEDSMLVLAYLQDVVAAKVTVSKEEIEAAYQQNKSFYHEPNKYKVLTLTRMSEQEAEDDYQKLMSGTDFSWLAKRHSTDDAREQGGERDWITRDRIPATLASGMDTMRIGTINRPVQTDGGLVIVKLVDRQTGAPLSLDRVKGSLEAGLQRKKQMEAIDSTIKQLRQSAEITIREDVINELRVTGKKG
jgi:hypothetical protein